MPPRIRYGIGLVVMALAGGIAGGLAFNEWVRMQAAGGVIGRSGAIHGPGTPEYTAALIALGLGVVLAIAAFWQGVRWFRKAINAPAQESEPPPT